MLLTEADAIGASIKKNCDFTAFVNPDSHIVRPNAKITRKRTNVLTLLLEHAQPRLTSKRYGNIQTRTNI